MTLVDKTFSDKPRSGDETGNAMIYVLVVIALFAALSFTLARQSNTTESGTLDAEKIKVYANQLIQQSNQIKQGLDQLIYSGSAIDDLDFVMPGEAGFSTPPHIDKVHHPEGGGIIMPHLPDAVSNETSSDPPAGWYLGRFNNVEWTPTAGQDVILTAHQIKKEICAEINETLTGSATIPVLTTQLREVLVDAARHSGSNFDLDTAACAACDGNPTLCVENASGTNWSFYSIVEQQ